MKTNELRNLETSFLNSFLEEMKIIITLVLHQKLLIKIRNLMLSVSKKIKLLMNTISPNSILFNTE